MRGKHPCADKYTEEEINLVRKDIESHTALKRYYSRSNTDVLYLVEELNINIMYECYKAKQLSKGKCC